MCKVCSSCSNSNVRKKQLHMSDNKDQLEEIHIKQKDPYKESYRYPLSLSLFQKGRALGLDSLLKLKLGSLAQNAVSSRRPKPKRTFRIRIRIRILMNFRIRTFWESTPHSTFALVCGYITSPMLERLFPTLGFERMPSSNHFSFNIQHTGTILKR